MMTMQLITTTAPVASRLYRAPVTPGATMLNMGVLLLTTDICQSD
jgi:hypothetical protein